MLEFVYTANYNPGDLESLVLHANLYAAADFYGVTPLKDLSKSKFHDLAAIDCIKTDFAEAAKIVYESTPSSDRALREVVAEAAGKHYSDLLRDVALFSEVLGVVAGLGKDVCAVLARPDPRWANFNRHQCTGCKYIWWETRKRLGYYQVCCLGCGESRYPTQLSS